MPATVTQMRTPAETALVEAFESRKADLPGLRAERAASMAVFATDGLPHRRVEEWKYTDLRSALREAQPPAGPPGIGEIEAARAFAPAFPGLAATETVFVNGSLVQTLGQAVAQKGVQVRSLKDALEHGDHLVEAHLGRLKPPTADGALALAAAFTAGGAIVHVDRKAKPEKPILLDFRFAGAAASVFPRVLIVVGDDAEVTVIESHRGPDGVAYQAHGITEVVLGKGAKLTHVKLQSQGDAAIHMGHALVELGARSLYETFTLEEGAAFARRQLFIRFAGEEASIRVNGATLATARQHLDSTMVVDHAVPHCTSQEIFKYVLAGQSRGVFQGKIIVRPDAQKTDGRMSARGLILEEGPEFDAKPELEIYADDVQCAHGATAGELDEDLMFYLRARGIPEGEAKALLVKAFVGEALEAVENDAVRDAVDARIEAWLAANLH